MTITTDEPEDELAFVDLHVAERMAALGGETNELVLNAVATAVRAVRNGSVAVEIDDATAAAVLASPLAAAGVVHVEYGLLYLDRYYRLERQVVDDLAARAALPPPDVDEDALAVAVERIRGEHLSTEQEHAAVAAARQRTTILTGGPGTGKTTTVARMLALIADQAARQQPGRRPSIALCAFTGKAVTRLHQAVVEELEQLEPIDRDQVGRPEAMTIHRLLGWRPDNTTRFRHDRNNRLKYDVVIVDETSLVELNLVARLLEAVRPEARLVLVGDPRQLTSVGAGAVLRDLVAGYEGRPDSPVVELSRNFRTRGAHIRAVAEALRVGDADAVLAALREPSDEVELVETDDPAPHVRPDAVASAKEVLRAAEAGDAVTAVEALDRHRLLCAHRDGPFGVERWNRQIEQWLGDETGIDTRSRWYVGRPLIVTSNDHALGIYNGETGAVVRTPDGRVRAVISGTDELRDFAPGRLDAVDTMHALTIHKSQGSQAERVTVLLPDDSSRLLTRELFYTAVTRAKSHLRVIGTEAAVRQAVGTEASRATGLRQRLHAASERPADAVPVTGPAGD